MGVKKTRALPENTKKMAQIRSPGYLHDLQSATISAQYERDAFRLMAKDIPLILR